MRESNQATSWLTSDVPPNCDVFYQFTNTVNTCMRQSGYTRAGLAERMNQALQAMEVQVDEAKLNKWFAPSQPTSMPVHFLPALLWALKSIAPANELLKPLLFSAVDQHAKMLQQHGQLEMEIQEKQQVQQEIQAMLLNQNGGAGHE